jgi:hypothetical protein
LAASQRSFQSAIGTTKLLELSKTLYFGRFAAVTNSPLETASIGYSPTTSVAKSNQLALPEDTEWTMVDQQRNAARNSSKSLESSGSDGTKTSLGIEGASTPATGE